MSNSEMVQRYKRPDYPHVGMFVSFTEHGIEKFTVIIACDSLDTGEKWMTGTDGIRRWWHEIDYFYSHKMLQDAIDYATKPKRITQGPFDGFNELVNAVVHRGENELNISLQPSRLEIGEVVVLGNSEISKEKAPYKVEVASAQDLKFNGMVTLTQTLASLPGISTLSNGLAISKPVVRGLYGYRVATVLNGVRFDNQQWQQEHGFGLESVGVDRIEVIEGPAALLYGAEAIGGVINLLPEKSAPVGRTLGNFNLKLFSNTLGAYSELGLKGADEKINWQIHLGGQSQADYLDGKECSVSCGNTRYMQNSPQMLFEGWHFERLVVTHESSPRLLLIVRRVC